MKDISITLSSLQKIADEINSLARGEEQFIIDCANSFVEEATQLCRFIYGSTMAQNGAENESVNELLRARDSISNELNHLNRGTSLSGKEIHLYMTSFLELVPKASGQGNSGTGA